MFQYVVGNPEIFDVINEEMVRACYEDDLGCNPAGIGATGDQTLDAAGIGGITRIHVTGHGKEMGITLGAVHYTEIPKEMLMIVVPDNEVAKNGHDYPGGSEDRVEKHTR